VSTKVQANGLFIASKGPEGKSIAAFPDVCMSPPGPPAGPVPLPYPNTALAGDMGPGSASVKAAGRAIMLQDTSFIAKSTGDEAATASFGAGVVSHTIQGKAYPQTFSPNVKIEGKGVIRSLDLVTHNHQGTTPGNTPPWPLIVTG
jgi:hypothetical protein